MSAEFIILATSILLLLCIFASKLSENIGIPALLFFLVIGMMAGSDGPGGIYFDNPRATQFIGVLALISILFSGGLDTKWSSVKPILASGILLSTVTVLFTAMLVAILSYYLLNFNIKESFLLGAIVSSTDAAAIFATFKSNSFHLNEKLKSLVKFESATNDPMAVLLTVGTLHFFSLTEFSHWSLLLIFFLQIFIGTFMGIFMGKIIPWTINKIKLEHLGLYPVLTICLILLTYSATELMQGNGFLAVFICGLIMGNNKFKHKKYLVQFHDGTTWLMQIIIFLTLGLLVFPSQLGAVLWVDLLIAFFLMLIARPFSVFITLILAKWSIKEKVMISWIGLRGAVPIILATFPIVENIPNATLIFNIVFFVVLSSILVQGTTITLLAKWLKLSR